MTPAFFSSGFFSSSFLLSGFAALSQRALLQLDCCLHIDFVDLTKTFSARLFQLGLDFFNGLVLSI
jgi:hypothetical protein